MNAQQRLVKVIDLIEDHLSESLYVDQLAESVNWSRWQLQRTFTIWLQRGAIFSSPSP